MNDTLRLTNSEISHLLWLMEQNKASGEYYGNRLHFGNRAFMLHAKLRKAADGARTQVTPLTVGRSLRSFLPRWVK